VKKVVSALALVSLVIGGCSGATEPEGSTLEAVSDGSPHIRQQTKAASAPSPLVDHGGDVIAHSNTYAIFWGAASDFPSDEIDGVRAMLGGLNGSAYLSVANQYLRAPTTQPTTSYAATSVYQSQGEKFLTSAPPSRAPRASDLGAQVCAIYGTPDPNGIYFFFTSNYPKVNYCAWHDKATCNGVTFQVGYMPNMQGVSGCSPFKVKNLGCNAYSEATQSLLDGLAHEFMEATTDPHIDAWYDKGGSEIGDKCNFVYGSCVPLTNGTSWQLQQEWSNAAGGCVDH
jgi:hypothetical protein